MIVHVALPLPLHKTFSYEVPVEWEPFAKPLARVKVPFGTRALAGFIVALEAGQDERLKKVTEILDIFPLIDEPTFSLCRWASEYYLTPMGMVLKYVLPTTFRVERYLRVRSRGRETEHLENLRVKEACGVVSKEELMAYHAHGLLDLYDNYTGSPFGSPEATGVASQYEPRLLIAGVERRREEYLKLILEQIDQGRNVLLLLPDYHTVGDYYYRFFARVLGKRVLWYSSAQLKSRAETFFRARVEKGCLILGNKSAVFLPVAEKALVIVERAEEEGYRNEEAFHFNAVKLALKGAEIGQIPILVGSVAPPLDLYRLAGEGTMAVTREELIQRESLRELHVTSGKKDYKIPTELAGIIDQAIRDRETLAIYTPRRDYASHLYCLECKKPFLCPACQSPLGYQKGEESLACPDCKEKVLYTETCSHCGGNLIQFLATGAEYLEEQLRTMFSEVPVVRITGEATRKKDVRQLQQMAGTPGTIVIGTQVLSKLYELRVHKLILMGQEEFSWVAGYRAHEKAFQIFRNLIDALRPAEVVLCMGKRSLIDVSHLADEQQFFEDELHKRRLAEFPPYARLFLIEVRKKTKESGERIVSAMMQRLEALGLEGQMIGSPLLQKKDSFRWRVLLKGDERQLAGVLPYLHGLPGARVEPDPPNI